jgi:hypothetical protein
MNTNKDDACARARALKLTGLTVMQIIPILEAEGYKHPRTLKPYQEGPIYKFVSGLNANQSSYADELINADDRHELINEIERAEHAKQARIFMGIVDELYEY